MWHPWRVLRGMAHIDLVWRDDLPVEVLGYTDGATIVLNRYQLQDERRSTLTHELVHLERGDTCSASYEPAVRAESARRLITIEALTRAAAGTTDLETLAGDLWVDPSTLLDRLRSLTLHERRLLLDATEHHRDHA